MAQRMRLSGTDHNATILTDLPTPTAASDAATKAYVDSAVGSGGSGSSATASLDSINFSNLAINGGFESGVLAPHTAVNAITAVDATDDYQGRYSLHVRLTAANAGDFLIINGATDSAKRGRMQVLAGEVYRLSALVRTGNTGGATPVYPVLRLYDGFGNEQQSAVGTGLTVAAGYNMITVEISVDSAASTYLEASLRSVNNILNDTLRVDDIRLERVATTSAVPGVQLASIGPISSLSGTSIVLDGTTAADGWLVLMKDQATASENGVYRVTPGQWVRAPGYSDSRWLAGALVRVERGSTNGGTTWQCSGVKGDAALSTQTPIFTRIQSGGATTTMAANSGAASTGSTVPVTPVGLIATVKAGKTYNFKVRGQVSSNVTTAALGMVVQNGTALLSTCYAELQHSTSLTGSYAKAVTTSTTPYPLGTITTTANVPFTMEGLIQVYADGSFAPGFFRQGSSGTLVIQPACSLQLIEWP